MLTPAALQAMSLPHLLSAAHAEIDSLTSTPLELELLRRVEELAQDVDAAEGFLTLVDEYEIKAEDVRTLIEAHPEAELTDMAKLLSALNDADIHTVEDLQAILQSLSQFRELANDAGDVFNRLADLAETATEE